ncbi:hypothetical protein ABKN59_007952 [Abortiporus biennis]
MLHVGFLQTVSPTKRGVAAQGSGRTQERAPNNIVASAPYSSSSKNWTTYARTPFITALNTPTTTIDGLWPCNDSHALVFSKVCHWKRLPAICVQVSARTCCRLNSSDDDYM